MSATANGLLPLTGPPILITGSPKSGKSVLLKLFQQLEEFHVVDEPLSTWRIGSHTRDDDRRSASDATDEVKQSIRHEILRQCQAEGASRYVDNLNHHALQIPFLREVFPDARIVVVSRSPQDFLPEALFFWTRKPTLMKTVRNRRRDLKLSTLASYGYRFFRNMVSNRVRGRLNTWGAIVPGQKEFASTHSAVELAAYHWAKLYEVALEHAQSDDGVYFVQFEGLLHRPRETIDSVLRFCETPVTPEIVDFAAGHFDPKFDFPKRIELTNAQWKTVWPIVRRAAEMLEYDVPD
ncbi:MAG: sulfotransferase [Aeoliella sp.]